MIDMLQIAAHIIDHFWKLRLFRKWDKGIVSNPEDKTSYTIQYHDVFLKYMKNKYCAKHRRFPVVKSKSLLINILFFSAKASRSGPSSYNPYDLCSDDKAYQMPKNVAKLTPGRSNRTACFLTATRFYLNSPPAVPQNCMQINPNHNNYHFDPIMIRSTFLIPGVTGWWCQQEETD
jgi:hypothetical protein